MMEKVKGFLKKKDIVFSVKRYGIDALGAMAQGLFCTLLIGTILNTLGNQFGVSADGDALIQGVEIVVVVGIVCATTMQYFSPFL